MQKSGTQIIVMLRRLHKQIPSQIVNKIYMCYPTMYREVLCRDIAMMYIQIWYKGCNIMLQGKVTDTYVNFSGFYSVKELRMAEF